MNKLRNKIVSEIGILKKEIPLAEYIFWWVCRCFQLYLMIDSFNDDNQGHYRLQMIANFILLFILPELHILPRKIFLARLHYRCQTVAAVMVVLTCGLGMYFSFYGDHYWYDTVLHLFGGAVLVLIGSYVVDSLRPKKEACPGPFYSSVAGFGISCFGTLFWECFEFIFDWIAKGDTQNYLGYPEGWLARTFPPLPEQYPVFDTMSDIIAGLLGAIFGAAVLRIIMQKKLSKSTKSL